MKIQELREIIKLIDHSSIDEFTFEEDGTKVKLKKKQGSTNVVEAPAVTEAPQASTPAAPSPAAPAPAAVPEVAATEEVPAASLAEQENLHKILSPMVGTFYQSPSPEEPAYVQAGTQVKAAQIVCIVEAMKLFNEIEAEVDGEIAEVLVKDGQLVEYGQPLFLVKIN